MYAGPVKNLIFSDRLGSAAACLASARYVRSRLLPYLLVLPGMASTNALAQDALAVKIGETRLFPSVALSYFSNDNALSQGNDPISTTGVRLAPSFSWEADQRTVRLQASYAGNFQQSSSGRTDFDDHGLSATAAAELSRRSRVSLGLSINRRHQGLGQGLTRFDPEAFDNVTVYNAVSVSAAHTYGARAARGNIETGIEYRTRSYTSNTQLLDGLDYQAISPYAEFSLRIAGNTRALFSLNLDAFSFDRSSRDRLQITGAVGVLWNEDEKTGGSFRVGSTRAKFEDDDRDDKSTLAIEGALWYLPVPYSRLELEFERTFEDDDGLVSETGELIDDIAIANEIALTWRHQWSSKVSHRASFRNRALDVECPADNQNTSVARFAGNIDVRRWLQFNAGVQHRRRDSDCDAENTNVSLDFEQFEYFIGLRATL